MAVPHNFVSTLRIECGNHETKEKNTYLLDPSNVSNLSTSIHVGGQYCFHARLLIVHDSIRVAAGDG